MSAHNMLIFLIVAIGITAMGVTVFLTQFQELTDTNPIEQQAQVEIIQVLGENITNNSLRHIRIQVTGNGVALNKTLISIKTENDVAELQYRNGTLNRSTSTGFYTQ